MSDPQRDVQRAVRQIGRGFDDAAAHGACWRERPGAVEPTTDASEGAPDLAWHERPEREPRAAHFGHDAAALT